MAEAQSANFTSLARLEIPGGGQITVSDGYAYVGHMDAPHGTTIIDVRDPRNPQIVSQIMLDDMSSHTHKVRVTGDYMVVNYEQAQRHFLRRAEGIADFERENPNGNDAELAAFLEVQTTDLPKLREAAARGYHDGGFRIYDVRDKANPRLLCHQKTHGFGVHRFDIDAQHLYMSTEMPGFVGNILVVYDFADPARPEEIGRWWMPEQENADGARPTWKGYQNRLHHALRFGDVMWASCWHAGFRILDAKDVRNIRTIGEHDYHPPGRSPTHTVAPLRAERDGRRFAAVIDEEHAHKKGQLPAHLWLFDVTDFADMRPVATFHVSALDSPYAGGPGRFGAHQFQEVIHGDTLFAAWFSGGLRAIDVSDPREPVETGHYVPTPSGGRPSPQSNDVFQDERGVVYLLDRLEGLDLLEFNDR